MKTKKNKLYFKSWIEKTIWFTGLLLASVFFYHNAKLPQKRVHSILDIRKSTERLETRLEFMQRTFRNEYNAYGRELGITGKQACYYYNKRNKKICTEIYFNEQNQD